MRDNIIKSTKIDTHITIVYQLYKKSEEGVEIVIFVKNNPVITIPSIRFPAFAISFQNSPGLFKSKDEYFSETFYEKLLKDLMSWSKNNYNTKFIDYKIGFPILKELGRVGETKFQIIFQQEILKEYATQGPQLKEFLSKEGYLKLIGDFF
jgi:hypothetical protein